MPLLLIYALEVINRIAVHQTFLILLLDPFKDLPINASCAESWQAGNSFLGKVYADKDFCRFLVFLLLACKTFPLNTAKLYTKNHIFKYFRRSLL